MLVGIFVVLTLFSYGAVRWLRGAGNLTEGATE